MNLLLTCILVLLSSVASATEIKLPMEQSRDATKLPLAGGVMSGPLTVVGSSVTVYQGGLIASSATINGPLTASSGTFVNNVSAASVTVSGNFSGVGFVQTNTSSSRFHIPLLSSGTIRSLTPIGIGDQYIWVDMNNTVFAQCTSTGILIGQVAISSNPRVAPCYEY